eukprot:2141403-Karenia_brevis.AAC.1
MRTQKARQARKASEKKSKQEFEHKSGYEFDREAHHATQKYYVDVGDDVNTVQAGDAKTAICSATA